MDKELLKRNGRKFRMIIDSATFALLLSIVLFSYEMISSTKETDKIVDNLMEIQGSLSTRYLGLFPEYIDNINNLLNNSIEQQNKAEVRDSIIIFEDVLYYGILSEPKGFRKMIENLITLTNNGCYVTLAYYDVNGLPFKHMIRDNLIDYEYQKQYREDINSYLERLRKLRLESGRWDPNQSREEVDKKFKKLVNKHFDDFLTLHPERGDSLHLLMRNINNYSFVDSVLSECYYKETCKADIDVFYETVKSLLQPLPQIKEGKDATSLRVNKLFLDLDAIKQQYMQKPAKDISYFDFYNMYKEISLAIISLFKQQPNIELIPLKESLMMCCWMSSINGREQAIFAFPSKYTTDEIGFISQDVAIARYIHTMLKGVKGTHLNK